VTDRRITKRAISDFLEHSRNPMELFLDEITVVRTSGSSGEVGMFVFSKEDWARGMAQVARNQPLPNPFKGKKIAFLGTIDGHYAGISWLNIIRQGRYKRYFDVLPLEINSPLPEIIEQLNAFQPDALSGYVTGTKALAEKQREGILKIAPAEITVGGEMLSDQDKAQLEQTFGCPVVNLYSCTEHMWMGNASAGQSSIGLWEDDLIFEIYEDHTIVTNLFNFTLPLIRYRMADALIPRAQKTTSRPYIQIDGIIGRMENTPKFINRDGMEDFISHFTINELFFVPGIRRFQMQLTGKAAFRFMVCLDSSLSPQQQIESIANVRSRLKEILRQKLMDNVSMEIIVADDLPVDPKSGKFQLILDAPRS
jgi:phenylacetate-CoA ligase